MLLPEDRISKQELERRYELVRKKMIERDLDALIVSGIRFVGATGYLRYLTNWTEPFGGEVLIFPANGTPIFFARTSERALLIKQFLGLETRAGSAGSKIARALKEMKFRRVGLCGLKTMVAEFYVELASSLSGVTLSEASEIIDEVRMVKSEEELRWVRKSATLTDMAFQLFINLVQPGKREVEVFIEIEHVMKQLGAENLYFMMSADPKPVAKFIDLAFDTYKEGDIVLFNAEIQGPGGYYTQLERTVCIGEPTTEVKEAYKVCVETEKKALSFLYPGTKASDVYDVIVKTIEERGYKMGLHPGHSQGLDIFERPLIDPEEKAVLSEGMVIVLHPHVLLPSGGGVWVGNTYLITQEGPVPLQRSSKDLWEINGF